VFHKTITLNISRAYISAKARPIINFIDLADRK